MSDPKSHSQIAAESLKKGSVLSLIGLMRIVGGAPKILFVAFVLSSASALLEGVTVALIIPLLEVLFKSSQVSGSIGIAKFIELPIPQFAQGSRSYLLGYMMTVILLATLGKTTCDLINYVSVGKMVQALVMRIRRTLFERFLSFGKGYYDHSTAGQLYNIVINYSQAVSHGLMEMRTILTVLLMSGIYLSILMGISWKLTLIGAAVYPLYHLAAKWISRKMARTSNDFTKTIGELSQAVAEVLGAIPLILSYATRDREKKRFGDLSDTVRHLETSMTRKHSFAIALQDFFMTTLMVGLALIAYLVMIRPESSTGAHYLVFFLVLRRLNQTLSSLLGIRLIFERIVGSVKIILGVFDDSDKFFVPNGTLPFTGLKSAISFKDSNFSYVAGQPVLKGVSFEITRGQMTAVIGPSGSGKSTIIGLLQRFYDVAPGSVFIDGVDIREYQMDTLREKIAVVSQDVYLFNTTFRENLCYGLKREVTDSELQLVLERTTLSDLVARLPNGLNTMIGERGVRLSGGEKQRLSIARAMLKGAEILLLDEATSALDTQTERIIQNSLNDLVKNRTVLIVAHRLSTVVHADKIVVIEKGVVVEQGGVEELLARRGRFHHYYNLQSFDSEKKKAG